MAEHTYSTINSSAGEAVDQMLSLVGLCEGGPVDFEFNVEAMPNQ